MSPSVNTTFISISFAFVNENIPSFSINKFWFVCSLFSSDFVSHCYISSVSVLKIIYFSFKFSRVWALTCALVRAKKLFKYKTIHNMNGFCLTKLWFLELNINIVMSIWSKTLKRHWNTFSKCESGTLNNEVILLSI